MTFNTGWNPSNTGYHFQSKEEYQAFVIPYLNLKCGDKICINDNKKIWEVVNTNLDPVSHTEEGVYCRSTVTVRTKCGYYGCVEREAIACQIHNEKDYLEFINGGQMLLF